MSLEEALKYLKHHEHFAVLINTIHQLREEAIGELHNANSETIQQISGRILTYDQILQIVDWQSLQITHGEHIKRLSNVV